MTKRQRAQVVELLRCANDVYRVGRDGFFGGTAVACVWIHGERESDQVRRIWRLANAAWDAAAGSMTDLRTWSYADVCLEAAARVEEGSWP